MKSPKTTIIGILLGLIPIGQEVLNGLGSGTHIDWKNVLLGLGFGVFGYFAKDRDHTGV